MAVLNNLRSWRRKGETAARSSRIALYRRLPVQTDRVVYESFAGNGALCNPEAIFRGLMAAPDMQHLRHVWVLRDSGNGTHRALRSEFAGDPRVSVVRPGSERYDRALATSGYLVNNATFPYRFARRPGQIYLNTWHGTPLKAMGYDVPDGALATRNVVRNIVSSDFLLAPNAATEAMYLDAYRGRNLFTGRLISEGTPRIDRQFASPHEKNAIRQRLRASGVAVDPSRRILLYAPTWRGDFYSPDDDLDRLRADVAQLRHRLASTPYQVLLKVHQQVSDSVTDDAALRMLLVPNDVPTNEVLAVTDALITDYSSIFVDFLATDRPILFYCPDLEDYRSKRGLNVPPEQWPGPIVETLDQLAEFVRAIGSGATPDPLVTHADSYAAARKLYCAREDGHATKRVIDIVFRGKADGYDVRPAAPDGRTRLLIYLGGMIPNGITTSALNLLNNIDHDRFDVSAFFPHSTRSDKARLIKQINPRVRLFPRSGPMLALPLDIRSVKEGEGWGAAKSHAASAERRERALRDEWVRCFGTAQFDHIIDFSGYGPFWTKILLQGRAQSFSVWLHNDLKSDADREVNGAIPHRANLYGMFDLYRRADHLVSVSPSLNEINRRNLARYADAARFTSARNTIDHRHILTSAEGRAGGPAAQNVALETTLWRRSGTRVFVTVGRFSPEKNHERLVRAFDLVHREDSDTSLVIIGSGPLQPDLRRLVADLGLQASVLFTGQQPNPYALMARTDCFVLSSDYEGQPMVILEAMVLGLPIVTTSFASVIDALPPGNGIVVERSVEALADGMRAFLRGEVPSARFDADTYNAAAIAEFESAIGMGAR